MAATLIAAPLLLELRGPMLPLVGDGGTSACGLCDILAPAAFPGCP